MKFIQLMQPATRIALLISLAANPTASEAQTEQTGSATLHLYEGQVVRIQVDRQLVNRLLPFASGKKARAHASGLLITPRQVLTNAHAVANEKFVRLGRSRDETFKSARVKFRADDLDLALLELEDGEESFTGTGAPRWGGVPHILDNVQAVGFPAGGEQLSVTSGIVSRVETHDYAHSMVDNHLLVQIDASINPGNSGGPVYSGSDVIGLSVQSNKRLENTAFLIPNPVIRKFLRDIEDGRYDGTARDEYLLTVDRSMENPDVRAFFSQPAPSGVQVLAAPSPTLLGGVLQPGDILLSLNGHTVDLDGKVMIDGRRIDYRHLFDLLQAGDPIKAEVLRAGATVQLASTMAGRSPEEFPHLDLGVPARYLIYGGLVFSTVTDPTLVQWADSEGGIPFPLRFAASYRLESPELSRQKEVIALTAVLPTPFNRRAREFEGELIFSVDGKPVTDLAGLKELLNGRDSGTSALRFFQERKLLIVDHDEMNRDVKALQKEYGIARMDSIPD